MRIQLAYCLLIVSQVTGQTYTEWYQKHQDDRSIWKQNDHPDIAAPSSPHPASSTPSVSATTEAPPIPRVAGNDSTVRPESVSQSNSTTSSTSPTTTHSQSVFDRIKGVFKRYPNLSVLLGLLVVIVSITLCLVSATMQCSRLAKNYRNATHRLNQVHQSSIIRSSSPNPPPPTITTDVSYGRIPSGITNQNARHPSIGDSGTETNPPIHPTFESFHEIPTTSVTDDMIYENCSPSSEPLLSRIPSPPPLPVIMAIP